MKRKPSGITDITRPNILAVDDVPSVLKSIELALKDTFNVHALSKSEDVMDFLRDNKPDLILLDNLMPVLTGFDLIPLIRVSPVHKNTPIVIVTTESRIEYVREAISLGATDYVLKPFEPKELRDKVAKHLGL
ncbi:MAG: response regulator [Treponema sp.]|jgi:PleD family two-component response regulator|nr:response regulator [Treponema sp.]